MSHGPILITGAAGFIGSHLVDRALADGSAVEAIDDLSCGSLSNLDEARASGGMRFHRLDVRASEFVELVERLSPSAVIHLAGHVDRPGSLLDPLFDADVNVLGTLNVLEAVRRHGVEKFAVVVHGLFRREHDTTGRIVAGQEARTPSHIASEAVVDYTRVHGDVYGLNVRVVCLANVYGPRQRVEAHGPVIARFVAAARSDGHIKVQGDGSQVRDFLYVDDAVDAIARSLDLESGAVVAVGTGIATSVRDVAELVATSHEAPVSVEAVAARAIERPGIAFPTEVAARLLRWRAWTTLPEGIRATLAST